MWNLEQNAGAIAGLRIASAGAPVRKIEQNLNSLAYDVVALVAANVGHESDPAGVVLLRGMVQALGGGRAIRFFNASSWALRPLQRGTGLCGSGVMGRFRISCSVSLVLEWDFRKGYGGSSRTLRLRNTLSTS
jgi:hypothetical protein